MSSRILRGRRRKRGPMTGRSGSISAIWCLFVSSIELEDGSLLTTAYDIFHLTTAKEPVQCIAGLSAALIS